MWDSHLFIKLAIVEDKIFRFGGAQEDSHSVPFFIFTSPGIWDGTSSSDLFWSQILFRNATS